MGMIKGIVAIVALGWLCLCAVVINQDMAISGQYEQADQFLYSIVSR